MVLRGCGFRHDVMMLIKHPQCLHALGKVYCQAAKKAAVVDSAFIAVGKQQTTLKNNLA